MKRMNGIRNSLIIGIVLSLLSCGQDTKSKSAKNGVSQQEAPWKIGVALYSFRSAPSFSASLDRAKKAGAKYVEGFSFQQLGNDFGGRQLTKLSDKQLEKVAAMVQDRDLKMWSMYAGAKTIAEWKTYFAIGKKLGLHFLVGEPERTQLDVVDSLAGANSMQLALHEHPKGQSIYWHPDSVLTALQGRPHLGACADIGHWVRSGLDPVESLQKLDGHLISLHVKNVDQAGNVDARWADLDQGVIDYKAVAAELLRQGFRGPVYVEDEREGDNVNSMQAAVGYLHRLGDEQSKN